MTTLGRLAEDKQSYERLLDWIGMAKDAAAEIKAERDATMTALHDIIHETAIHEKGRWTLKPYGTLALERGVAILVQFGLAVDAGRGWYRWSDGK